MSVGKSRPYYVDQVNFQKNAAKYTQHLVLCLNTSKQKTSSKEKNFSNIVVTSSNSFNSDEFDTK